MRRFALILFLLNGCLAGVVTKDYLSVLNYGADNARAIKTLTTPVTGARAEELSTAHNEAFQSLKMRMELTLFFSGMVFLTAFGSLCLNMRAPAVPAK